MNTSPSTLALNLVTWFANGSGEFGLEEVAAMFGIDHEELKAWAKPRGLLFYFDLHIGSECWPAIWQEFQTLSPIAKELDAAFESHLVGGNARFVEWSAECVKELRVGALGIAHLSGIERDRILASQA